ncbi:MAG TPA: HAMP domain-containing sensor histidine kinase, partial [Novosphingobium sp.]|nr:HAMP domain-containing sensor histidine kinase [Novosphingobium sp.]
EGLLNALQRHSASTREQPFHYLLQDAQGRRLFGDIPAGLGRPGAATITLAEPDSGPVAMRQFGMRIGDGQLLVVATDFFDIENLRHRLARYTLLGAVAISLCALFGGYGVGRLFLRRLDGVNRQVERIVAGNGAERLPAIGLAPEFDTLTRNLNHMLERQDAAMEGLRQVSTAIAHDLRTPLTRLHQRLESLNARLDADAGVELAIGEVEGLLSTFQALLRIGMIEGGMGRGRFQPVDLSEELARIVETYAPVAEDAGHRLGASLAAGLWVEGDAELLTQLFINLVENAIVHTPVGTAIHIALAARGDRVCATVSDDGPGVDPADHARIFRRFYRCAASKGLPGTGLGLSLVAAIADMHGAACTLLPADRGFALELAFPRWRGG